MPSYAVRQRRDRFRAGENRSVTQVVQAPARAQARSILLMPFSRRSRAEFRYAIVSLPVAIAGYLVTAGTFVHPLLVFVSTPVMRELGALNRHVLHRLLGERVQPPPPMRWTRHLHVRTPEATRLAGLVAAAGGQVREQNAGKLKITRMTASQLAELAAREQVIIEELKTHSDWLAAAIRDVPGWRARAYLLLKLPVSVAMFVAAAGCWLTGLWLLTAPLWWMAVVRRGGFGFGTAAHYGVAVLLVPVGAAVVLAAPWLTRATVAADRSMIRGLLGPSSLAQRVRDLEQTRAHAVDDSAARLRSIERDLHDGAQAQLVGLAMKLGLAREKLGGGSAESTTQADLDRAAELVEAAHRSAIEAIAELRVLARGIHPPVLDNGLPDALATLAARSAVPVELITDVPERPSAAIETIAYFCAAELLANVAKHSGARHATLEAVHVPGLLRVRVTDDGRGGARPDASGGLRGLAERIRTVDGRLQISSPRGGPTVVTVELPSHA